MRWGDAASPKLRHKLDQTGANSTPSMFVCVCVYVSVSVCVSLCVHVPGAVYREDKVIAIASNAIYNRYVRISLYLYLYAIYNRYLRIFLYVTAPTTGSQHANWSQSWPSFNRRQPLRA